MSGRPFERAKPLLGTVVAVRAYAGDADLAHAAIDAAFARVAAVHAAMSVHAADSDLSAVGRAAPGQTVPVGADTRACLALALELAGASGGVFDPVTPGGGATWRDLALTPAGAVAARPLKLDLAGLAKGYAVDCACTALREAGITRGVVNAGGDLRVFGPEDETVTLTPRTPAPHAAVRLRDGALASSDVADALARHGESRHRDGRTGAALDRGFVAVAAVDCAHADALTKVVLALDVDCEPLLHAYAATAYLHRPGEAWQILGASLGASVGDPA